MSNYQNKPLTGAVFKVKQKKHDNSPDYNGNVVDQNGTEYWLAGWIKRPKSGGDPYISVALTPKDETQQAQGRGQSSYEEPPEDVPF